MLTVGAIDRRGVLASFSSIGNTADNRVKPDVVAVGLNSDVMGTNGNLRKASGTSFASPILVRHGDLPVASLSATDCKGNHRTGASIR